MQVLLVARLLHVVLGAFWAGAIFFNALVLGPAIQDLGPDGGKVMGALGRRGIHTVLPIVGVVTILSGLWLYWIVSAGFNPDYMGSRPGKAYGFGLIMSLVALGIGLGVMRPSVIKLATAQPAEAQVLRGRVGAAGKWVAACIALAIMAMAVGRYL